MSLTEEQKKLRRTAIGSSDIGTILGLSPYAPIEIWRQKVEGYDRPDNPDMERGRFLEPAVADWYAHRTQTFLEDPGTMVCPTNPLVVATPDRIAHKLLSGEKPWTVELKTCSRSDDLWGTPGTDEIPSHYLAQVQWELIVTGHERADLAVLKWGRTLDIFTIPADRELQASLVQMGTEWWDRYVKTATPPPVDGSDEYAAFLKHRFPKDERPMLSATAEVEARATALRELEAEQKRVSLATETQKNFLRAVIGDAEGIAGNGWSVSWKARKDGVRVLKTKWKESA